jgi:hypothetical protein
MALPSLKPIFQESNAIFQVIPNISNGDEFVSALLNKTFIVYNRVSKIFTHIQSPSYVDPSQNSMACPRLADGGDGLDQIQWLAASVLNM